MGNPALFGNQNFPIKLNPLNLEFPNQDHSRGFLVKVLGKSVKGFLSYDKTSKQTDRFTKIIILSLDIDENIFYLFNTNLQFHKTVP